MTEHDPNDPTGWPRSQQAVLRWIAAEGCWSSAWAGAPRGPARAAVERRLGITFQREHPLHESPWYAPHTERDRDLLMGLAAKLPAEDGPWSKSGAHGGQRR